MFEVFKIGLYCWMDNSHTLRCCCFFSAYQESSICPKSRIVSRGSRNQKESDTTKIGYDKWLCPNINNGCPSQFMAIFMEQIIGFKPWDVEKDMDPIDGDADLGPPASHCSGRLARTSSKNWVSKITPSEARSKLFGAEIQLYIDPLISSYMYIYTL